MSSSSKVSNVKSFFHDSFCQQILTKNTRTNKNCVFRQKESFWQSPYIPKILHTRTTNGRRKRSIVTTGSANTWFNCSCINSIINHYNTQTIGIISMTATQQTRLFLKFNFKNWIILIKKSTAWVKFWVKNIESNFG